MGLRTRRKCVANVMAKDAATAAVIRRRQSSRKLSEREAYSWSSGGCGAAGGGHSCEPGARGVMTSHGDGFPERPLVRVERRTKRTPCFVHMCPLFPRLRPPSGPGTTLLMPVADHALQTCALFRDPGLPLCV